jgi:hypothetical protein
LATAEEKGMKIHCLLLAVDWTLIILEEIHKNSNQSNTFGIHLTQCWNPATINQGSDHAIRFGQKDNVILWHLYTNISMDEEMWVSRQATMARAHTLLDPRDIEHWSEEEYVKQIFGWRFLCSACIVSQLCWIIGLFAIICSSGRQMRCSRNSENGTARRAALKHRTKTWFSTFLAIWRRIAFVDEPTNTHTTVSKCIGWYDVRKKHHGSELPCLSSPT